MTAITSAKTITRDFKVDPRNLLPHVTPDSAPFWDGLKRGDICAQTRTSCKRGRWPVAPVCPHCGSTEFGWRACAPRATVYSFVRYRRSYLPEFEDLMPYVVVDAALDADVRMYGRLIGSDSGLRVGAPLDVVIEQWPDNWLVPAFQLSGAK